MTYYGPPPRPVLPPYYGRPRRSAGQQVAVAFAIAAAIVVAIIVGALVLSLAAPSSQPTQQQSTSRSYQYGHDRVGPDAVYYGGGDSCEIRAGSAWVQESKPYWWDADAVVRGCVDYVHEHSVVVVPR